MCIVIYELWSFGTMKQLPQLRFRITEEEDNARKFLNNCGYNVNFLIRKYIIQLYEKELAKQSLA